MSGILVETDIFLGCLSAPPGSVPLLRQLLQATTCYSTFIQAAELYVEMFAGRGGVEPLLGDVKILGASSRYSKTIGRALSSLGSAGEIRTAIVGAMAIENRLPVVTDVHYEALAGVSGIQIYRGRDLEGNSLEALTKLLSGSS